MVLCNPCNVDGTKVFHSSSCNRTQSKVSPELMELGLQFGSQVARLIAAIPPDPHQILQYNHLANDPRNQLYKSSEKKRISVAVSQRNCRIKNEIRILQQSVKHDYKSSETLDAFIPSPNVTIQSPRKRSKESTVQIVGEKEDKCSSLSKKLSNQ